VKGLVILLVLMVMAPAAQAERMGGGQGSFIFAPEPVETRVQAPRPAVVPKPPAPVAPATSLASDHPAPPPRPAHLPSAQPAQGSTAPFQATLGGPDTRCPDPIAHPNARNTPVKVYVDQQTQRIEIQSPDLPKPREAAVSTGGGLKIPNGEIKKPPYCARTPRKDRLIISAVREEMFKGTGCTPDEIRAKSTVFPMYHTRTFTDKDGKPIPMPRAIRITGGIFFHEVPPSYKEMLGHNVSGECVRLPANTAAFLQKQIEKYGAIEVTMSDPPQVSRQMPQYCDEQMVARARGDVQSGQIAAAQRTGSEGVYGGNESFFSVLGRLFGGGQQSAPVARTAPPQPRPRREHRDFGNVFNSGT